MKIANAKVTESLIFFIMPAPFAATSHFDLFVLKYQSVEIFLESLQAHFFVLLI